MILSKTADKELATIATTADTYYLDTNAEAGVPTFYWVIGIYQNAAGTRLAAGATSPYAWATIE